MTRERRPRIAIVGGGCAAMTAAWELTHGENAGRFDVTVYQMDWRLGGKGASGRGVGGRIEEHGLHLWMGHYDNAFSLIRRRYDELGRDWREAFVPAPDVGLMHPAADGNWQTLLACFPPMPGTPGDPRHLTLGEYATRAIALLRELLRAAENVERRVRSGATGDGADRNLRQLLTYGELGMLTAALHALHLALLTLRIDGETARTSILARVLEEISTSLSNLIAAALERNTASRYLWEIVDVVLAQIRGAARMMRDGEGIDQINRHDIREWLALNGASPQSLESAFVRGLYDLAFAYEDGDPGKPGIAAGEGLLGSMRMFLTYRESLFWKMQGGMGDVVFAPLYEALKRRGVRFEFFHRLENVGTGTDGAPHVTGLTFTRQAIVQGGGEYQPLVDYDGVPCWPAEPDWGQLEQGDRLRAAGADFEAPESPGVDERTLKMGRDFDYVVLGIGIGAVRLACRELIDSDPRWQRMCESVRTVATQSLQLWLTEDLNGLGWSGASPSVSAFVTPFDTWADMSHLAAIEKWQEPAGSIGYFCSVLPGEESLPDPDHARRSADQVRRNAVRYLDTHVRHLWPGAVNDQGFRWELLAVAPGLEVCAEADAGRIRSQYWRANVQASERYTLSLPGTIEQRLSPLDTTHDNLTICGDWTDCGFNLGCVEAAVMSGRLAAHALSRYPRLEDIDGYDLS